jgi:hypothetical protein
MTSPLCGMLPMYVSAMCFDSLSTITVKYVFQLLTITAYYIPLTECVLTSFFPRKQNRNIDIKIIYHYNTDATASLRGKL